MDRIDVGAQPAAGQRSQFFARTIGTRFAAAAEGAGGATTIDLYDEIGYWGVTAKNFRQQLKAAPGDVVLRINSPGGDVFDGIAIYNDLLAHEGTVRCEIIGLAASAASLIAMAGDEIAIAENAFFMIHNAWTIALGNRHDLAEVAAVLAKIDDAMARTYTKRTKAGIRSVVKMMDDETWLNAKDAQEHGFADSLIAPAGGAQAQFDLSVFARAPEALRVDDAVFAADPTERDVEKRLMRDAGHSRSQARALIRAIRAYNPSHPEAKPGAGALDLGGLAAAVNTARASFSTR